MSPNKKSRDKFFQRPADSEPVCSSIKQPPSYNRGGPATNALHRLVELTELDESCADVQSKARWFRLFVLVHSAATAWFLAETQPHLTHGVRAAIACIVTLCAVAGFRNSLLRAACIVATALYAFQIAALFPILPNHTYLEFALLLCTSFFAVEPNEDRYVLLSARWLVILVLFASGLQKLMYGTYLHGDMLVLLGAYDTQRFGWLLKLVVSPQELAAAGEAECFRIASSGLTLVSNAVYLAEMFLPIALLMTRTRQFAVWASVLLILGIELGAREATFGLLVVTQLFLLFPRNRLPYLLPIWILVYSWMLAQWFRFVPLVIN